MIFPAYRSGKWFGDAGDAGWEPRERPKYPIQHSAGPASRTLSRLVDPSARRCGVTGISYSISVIVVTDRTVLDKPVVETIAQPDHASG